jgi:hypothetical protein
MELSPEEKKKIYEEEKVRVEAQKKAKDDIKGKETAQGCLVLVVIVVLLSVFGFFNSDDETKKSSSSISQTMISINPSVRFVGTQFIIVNKDSFDWTNVKLEVNSGLLTGGFVLKTRRMKSGETYTVGAMQFAKGDGTRLNPFTTKPQNLSIWGDTPKGKGFWYGGWN